MPAAELARRFEAWQPPEPRYRSGVMAKYAALVSSASYGAVTTGRRLASLLNRRSEVEETASAAGAEGRRSNPVA